MVDERGLTTDGDKNPYFLFDEYSLCRSGMKLWEGIYNNNYDEEEEIWYDDFGTNGYVEVKVQVSFWKEGRTIKVFLINNKENMLITNSELDFDIFEFYESQSIIYRLSYAMENKLFK